MDFIKLAEASAEFFAFLLTMRYSRALTIKCVTTQY